MKKLIAIVFLLFSSSFIFAQQIGQGNLHKDSSVMVKKAVYTIEKFPAKNTPDSVWVEQKSKISKDRMIYSNKKNDLSYISSAKNSPAVISSSEKKSEIVTNKK